MKNYQRLALFLIILFLSVALLSTAISILGDITDLDLEEDVPGLTEASPNPAGLGKSSGEEIPVDDPSMADMGPIFEIIYPPKTVYLKRMVAEEYREGVWVVVEDAEKIEYGGETIKGLEYPGEVVTFIIDPLLNMRNYAPVPSNVRMLNETFDYYPELGVFGVPEPTSQPYLVLYNRYEFEETILRSQEHLSYPSALQFPENLSSRVRAMALEITEGEYSSYGRYNAIEEYLRQNYVYNDDFYPGPNGTDPVEWFLFNGEEGISSHFNSAFILLARSVGLPARAVMGFQVKPDADNQFVMPQQAHLYAEVPLGELGWVGFDATPFRIEEDRGLLNQAATFINITGNDAIAVKGKQFNVWGTVNLGNGSAVSGPQVEVYLYMDKSDPSENGTICGVGVVVDGFFNVTCDAAHALMVGDYDLVGHSLKTARYAESWSDPPIRVVAETRLLIEGPGVTYIGKEVRFGATLLDSSNEEVVPEMNITVALDDGEAGVIMTDGDGQVFFGYSFEEEGNRNITFATLGDDYYLGSNSTFMVSVMVTPEKGLLALLMSFPYNILIVVALGSVLGLGIVMSSKGKPAELLIEVMREPKPGFDEDLPLTFDTYEEGIVKIFNRFFNTAQRIYPQIDDSLTPREFESFILAKIPRGSEFALDDLVTSFEIAEYGNMRLGKEDFERCMATVELLLELVKGEKKDAK